jgi:PGF-CTERM protein
MRKKTKAIMIVLTALIGICVFAPIVSAETAEEWNEKGISFAKSDEYEKAIECFDKAIELDPNYANAYNNRGLTYYHLKQYERAIEDYNKAIELNPNGADAYYNRELARSKLKEQKGVPGFEAVFAIAGLLAVAYLLRREQ